MAPIPGVIQIHGDITKVRTNGIVCYVILAITSGIPRLSVPTHESYSLFAHAMDIDIYHLSATADSCCGLVESHSSM